MDEKRKKILIWGTGNTTKNALGYLSKEVEIIGFCDNNFGEESFLGYPIIGREYLRKYDYDYIVICSIYHQEIYNQLLSLGIMKEKILIWDFQKTERFRIYKENFFQKKVDELLGGKKPEVIISGISYHNDGIDSRVFVKKKKHAFNFALRGQDIFYDFQIAKFLESINYLERVSHYIVGLCYYSFEYDLSKTINGWEIVRYYPYIKEPHNLIDNKLFDKYVYKISKEMEKNEICYNLFSHRNPCVIDYQEGENVAKIDFNKNYPLSVWENKEILKEFVVFLRKKDIQPIIVIMPAVKGYVSGCPNDFKTRFYSALNESIEGMNVQVLDYFRAYYGEDADYYHVSHFNKIGAQKFTEILIQDIEW